MAIFIIDDVRLVALLQDVLHALEPLRPCAGDFEAAMRVLFEDPIRNMIVSESHLLPLFDGRDVVREPGRYIDLTHAYMHI